MAMEHPSNSLPENTIIETYEYFILIPTIGPLIDGHVMLASKQHYTSLSVMPQEAIDELFMIISTLSVIDEIRSNVLICEHGSFENQSGGACTVHTHIHLIPTYGSFYNVLDGMLPIVEASLTQLGTLRIPYILTMNGVGEYRIYEAYNAHSQMMRKAICNSVGQIDKDWKSNPNPQSILNTIDYWSKLIPE